MEMVSVIIPVYNSEKYIGRCIQSVINQTCQDYEIIVINDGSKDNSERVIKKYIEKYPKKIRYFYQDNKGVATTRNEAIYRANGDYIMFIDNDDFIEENYIEIFLDAIKKENLDVVLGGYKRPSENGKIIKSLKLKNTEWSKFMVMTPWAKILKKKYLIDNNITFLKNNIGEDIYFNLKAVLLSKKVKIIDYVGYNWFFNTESVSNSKQKNIKNLQVMDLLNNCYDMLKNEGLLEENYEIVEYHFIRYIVWILSFSTKNLKYNEISEKYDELFQWLNDRFINYKKNKLVKFSKPDGEIFKVRFMVKMFMVLHKLHLAKLLTFIYSKL